MKNKSYQTGMTLIEIMIALLIGAFLLGGVLQIFINAKQTYRMQEGLSRLQENGRFAMEFIARDIRMAGYWGCINPSNADTDVAGANNNAAGTVDSIDDGTDSITLRGGFVQVPTGACGSRDISAEPFYTHASSTMTYKINNGVLQQDTNGLNNALVEGIENMQIRYGVDTDAAGTPGAGTPNYYVPANDVTAANWPNVISIRISLLAATVENNLAAQPITYIYDGATTPGTDRRIRRVFNTTIAVRNRLQ